ncbi:DUF4393 domain-containing protein [Paramagnetospirillum magneticum]|uniref:DUF4393 domain-containing protein n=1 Tax=Paramagnetospirillum magneticum TaxID=84159 RepID=UPI0011D12833|nr:DUF4393 domain-containing protein [Paramagnetospirillum magneticum]
MDKPKRARPKAEKLPSTANLQSPPRGLSAAAAELIIKAFAPASENIGGLLGDLTAHFKARNLDKLARYWRGELEKREVSPEALAALPFATAHRVFDDASKEDDDDVLKLWASLLVGAMTRGADIQAHKMLCGILKDLEGPDAVLLEIIWMRANKPSDDRTEYCKERLFAFEAERWNCLSNFMRQAAVQNIMRLGCAVFSSSINTKFKFKSLGRNSFNRDPLPSLSDQIEDTLSEIEQKISSAMRYSSGADEPSGFHESYEKKTYLRAAAVLTLTPLGRTLMEACRGNPWRSEGASADL